MQFLLLILLGITPFLIKAQTNYISTTPLSSTPVAYNTMAGGGAGNLTTAEAN
ncbi:hypothetical protein GO730_07700 [Spirosoma sp. HMF3257]|uniref:hypothetical protein n=1 Tax=Spirosoma telluris TaxID=2183553 RepID=UPI0012F9F4DF|nr:hypothetical protein [Spirosoma telluris]